MLTDTLEVDAEVFAARTGWVIKQEGACKGEICVPLPDAGTAPGGAVDVRAVAARLGMPIIEDAGMWAVGPETAVTGRALSTAVAPELELPDVNGQKFRLSSLRGQKVVLLAWASW